jgi:hypothetical protein
MDGPLDYAPEIQPDLWGTFWIFDEPGMDDILEQAGDSLQAFFDKLKVGPVQADQDKKRIFLARYEFPGYQQDYEHPDGIVSGKSSSDVLGFIDFLCGFPYGDIEILGVVGELSTKTDKLDVVDGTGNAAPPVPNKLFEGIEEEKILANYMWLPTDGVDLLAKNLNGTADTKNPHWWLRWNIINKKAKFPIPGEMLFLGVRLFPSSPWNAQRSNPFLFSGNFMDTLYYTSAKITKVNDPVDPAPYNTYEVQWRKQTVTARPSDFTSYQVDDRVAVLKAPSDNETSQTWDKNKTFDETQWVIAPITFYEVEDN